MNGDFNKDYFITEYCYTAILDKVNSDYIHYDTLSKIIIDHYLGLITDNNKEHLIKEALHLLNEDKNLKLVINNFDNDEGLVKVILEE